MGSLEEYLETEIANFSYSVLQSTLLHLDKVEQGFTQEITTTEPFCRQKNYHKNRHILPTGQWYAPSAVNNDALIMSEYARVCQSMPEHTRVCQSMP